MVLEYIGHISTDPVNDETGVDIWFGFADKEQLDTLWEMDEDEEEDWEDEE